MDQFKKWLKAQLAYLDKLANEELHGPDCDDVKNMAREAGRGAALLAEGQNSKANGMTTTPERR